MFTKYSRKSTEKLFYSWCSFKKMRNQFPDSFGPEDNAWISSLDREELVEELFNRLLGKLC
jgi:hypothetical protein